MAEQKSEKPTPRRRQKAREQGQVPRSKDLGSILGILLTLGPLIWQAQVIPAYWRGFFRVVLDRSFSSERLFSTSALKMAGLAALSAALPLMALTWAVTLGGSLAQGGLVVAPSALVPNLSRLSPATKLRQLFSIQSAFSMLKSLVPGAVIAYFVTAVVIRDWNVLCQTVNAGFPGSAAFLFSRLLELSWKSALVLGAWAALDYFLERQKLERDLRMTKQEIREEIKETEGNPAIKMRVRRLQRQLRRRRMLQDVSKATVVITNPTHFAVGLAYGNEYAAPVVVAKGRNLLAQQIRQAAIWHNVPLVENRPLAHALYRAVDIGQMIPPKLYAAVAEVLAFIYRAQARVTGK